MDEHEFGDNTPGDALTVLTKGQKYDFRENRRQYDDFSIIIQKDCPSA